MRQIVRSPKVPSPKPPISHAVRAGNLVFVSATTPWRLDYTLDVGDFGGQMRQSFANLEAVLEAAGTSIARVVKITVLMARIQDAPEMNAIYTELITARFPDGDYPARTSLEARMGVKDFLVEIECVAEAG